MTYLNTLLDLPRSAVYAIVDEKHKRVLVTFSTSVASSLVRLCEKIKLGESYCRNLKGVSDLKFVVLETDEDTNPNCRNRLMIRTGFYMREYKALGYELLVEHPPVQYTLKCVPRYETDYLTKGANGRWILQAFLVSKRNSKILVGEFRTQASYDAFKLLNYSIEPFNDLVYDDSVVVQGTK